MTSRGAGGGTAVALVDAAEELFAEHGFDRASLRAVMRAAGADPGSVHYHFGGRPELAAAVLDRVLRPLNDRRVELLEEAVAGAGHGPVPLVALLDALVRPDLEVAHVLEGRGGGRSRLVGAIYGQPAAFVTEQVEQHFAPVAQRFLPHLVAAVPHVPPPELAWRIRWWVFGVLGALLSDGTELEAWPLDQLVARLTGPGAAAVAAPPTGEPPPVAPPSDAPPSDAPLSHAPSSDPTPREEHT